MFCTMLTSSSVTTAGHLMNIISSIYSCKETKSVVGVSIKSFELYVVAFGLQLVITDDCITVFIRLLCVIAILYLINMVYNEEPYKSAFLAIESSNDSFSHWKYIVLPSFILAIATNFVEENFTISQEESSDGRRFTETLGVFCLFLEAAAPVPQIVLLYRFKEIENFKWYNIAALVMQNLSCILCGLFMNDEINGRSNYTMGGDESFKLAYDQKRRNYGGWLPIAIELFAGLLQIGLCVTFVYLYFHIKFNDRGGLQKLQ